MANQEAADDEVIVVVDDRPSTSAARNAAEKKTPILVSCPTHKSELEAEKNPDEFEDGRCKIEYFRKFIENDYRVEDVLLNDQLPPWKQHCNMYSIYEHFAYIEQIIAFQLDQCDTVPTFPYGGGRSQLQNAQGFPEAVWRSVLDWWKGAMDAGFCLGPTFNEAIAAVAGQYRERTPDSIEAKKAMVRLKMEIAKIHNSWATDHNTVRWGLATHGLETWNALSKTHTIFGSFRYVAGLNISLLCPMYNWKGDGWLVPRLQAFHMEANSLQQRNDLMTTMNCPAIPSIPMEFFTQFVTPPSPSTITPSVDGPPTPAYFLHMEETDEIDTESREPDNAEEPRTTTSSVSTNTQSESLNSISTSSDSDALAHVSTSSSDDSLSAQSTIETLVSSLGIEERESLLKSLFAKFEIELPASSGKDGFESRDEQISDEMKDWTDAAVQVASKPGTPSRSPSPIDSESKPDSAKSQPLSPESIPSDPTVGKTATFSTNHLLSVGTASSPSAGAVGATSRESTRGSSSHSSGSSSSLMSSTWKSTRNEHHPTKILLRRESSNASVKSSAPPNHPPSNPLENENHDQEEVSSPASKSPSADPPLVEASLEGPEKNAAQEEREIQPAQSLPPSPLIGQADEESDANRSASNSPPIETIPFSIPVPLDVPGSDHPPPSLLSTTNDAENTPLTLSREGVMEGSSQLSKGDPKPLLVITLARGVDGSIRRLVINRKRAVAHLDSPFDAKRTKLSYRLPFMILPAYRRLDEGERRRAHEVVNAFWRDQTDADQQWLWTRTLQELLFPESALSESQTSPDAIERMTAAFAAFKQNLNAVDAHLISYFMQPYHYEPKP